MHRLGIPENVDAAATRFVAEMSKLGARFELSGPDHDPRWHYEAAPGMRDAARAHMLQFDRPPFGFDRAVCEAIRRLRAEGAP